MKFAGALLVLAFGHWSINLARHRLMDALERHDFESATARRLTRVAAALLTLLLLLCVLGILGIETSSFAVLLVAAGVALGAGSAGLLAHLAAGLFLILLRPFQPGDHVNAGGVEGHVVDIGLFASIIDTPENVRTMIGNARILAADMRNYSANAYRRAEVTVQLAHSANLAHAIHLLRKAVAPLPNVLESPAPEITILALNEFGT
jgi:small conductance mechanosensitive channel